MFVAIALLAFGLRAVVRLYDGASAFWQNGYVFYFHLARNLAQGHGFSADGLAPTAFRVPLYPIFVAAITGGERAFVALVLAQSLIGTGTVVCGAWLAGELFGTLAVLPAASMLAVYPYYVVHDTALQETSLFTFLTLVAVLLLVRARRRRSVALSLVAGAALAAAVLTRSTLVPFMCVAPLWLCWAVGGPNATRARCTLAVSAALLIGLSPWLAYSRSVTGSATLGTETGYMLWRGNNPHTFSRYPLASMDESAALAYEGLSARDRTELEAITDPRGSDRWFLKHGRAYMAEDPIRTVGAAARKLTAAFGLLPSPRHDPWQNLANALSYGPVLLLGMCGLVLTRRDMREHSLLCALFLSFAAVTAVFFGHTSHRAFLDVYLIAYATVPITRVFHRRSPTGRISAE
jgi:4-amino-4-deoxy-L-arabinose transferase-like glycosyltransferase